MTNFEKLFVHLYTKGIEHYRDSGGTLRAIDDVLNKSDDLLYTELHEAFNQANRVNIFKEYNIPLEIHGDIPKDLPIDLITRLLDDAIDINKLKTTIKRQAGVRYN